MKDYPPEAREEQCGHEAELRGVRVAAAGAGAGEANGERASLRTSSSGPHAQQQRHLSINTAEK